MNPLSNRIAAFAISICAMGFLGGCASTSGGIPADPLEGFNRGMFSVNDTLDSAVLKPVAKAYVAVTPSAARAGVSNAFGNIGEIGTALNNLLQGKPGNALSDVGRLVINSTLGVLGLWDVATPMGLAKNDEDFGQTLGKWGVGSGPYLVLPFSGPSTVRDSVARFSVDRFTGYNPYIDHKRTSYSVTSLELINGRAGFLAAGDALDAASTDKYAFLRDAFLQRRLNQLHDGAVPSAAREALIDSLESAAPLVPPAKNNAVPATVPAAATTPATPSK